MPTADTYTQCTLTRRRHGTISTRVVWIPQKFAVIDTIVKVRENSRSPWEDGWLVSSAYQTIDVSSLRLRRDGSEEFTTVLDCFGED